ncbi:FIG147869: Carbon-nitrogen hydrolase / Aliphatic amidase AmiE [Candidatus Phaeomarinobacter ectocarpi]|uniref:FIG147869: Carbon-nitrogen hydrolase / Aliphatic amidase AmiE n=1 Tax=Candidatus Phaeomarinibacter ectocarpi TaxID=1458461 RepID=X5ML41_9HYPH|nr:carbon-nitrogen hydrolase family protein [Candidatus Phaeomarinobacter ectocarpi]CDO59135.1 FIG147869: Carbon-nitrogen hydrolase / Aliphatic amidase AmiE [Candidatus Phaeomarinobacter ectocarpi]
MSAAPFRAACVTLCSGREPATNIEAASDLVRDAARNGAGFICTPENTLLMESGGKHLLAAVKPEDDTPAVRDLAALAADLGIWLSVGSLAIKVSEDKVANRSFLMGPDGRIHARYDKIHMFDVSLPNGESYLESKSYRPGGDAVLAQTGFGTVGLTVCYDLRFPDLYRTLAQAGAEYLTVPSAFTQVTGEAHWHVLLRARAIETGAFVFAAAQSGTHENGRKTYGHSLIIDPWGEVLVDGGLETGFVCADIDPAKVEEARSRIPSLTHDRDFALRHASEVAPLSAQ